MADIAEIGDLAHELESLYEGLCAGNYRASPALFQLLQACHDRLAEMLDAVRAYRSLPSGLSLVEMIRRFLANPQEQLSMPESVPLKAAQDAAEAEILDIFVEEADELLEQMDAALSRWEAVPDSADAIEEMMRILHTLKGGARLAAQVDLGDMAHDLEQTLAKAQQEGAPWPESLFLEVQGAYDRLHEEVERMRSRLIDEPDVPAVDQFADEPVDTSEPAPVTLATPIVAASTQAPVVSPFPSLPFPSVSLAACFLLPKSFLASKQLCLSHFRLAATSTFNGLILAMICVLALSMAIRKSRRFVICLNGLRQTVCSAAKNLYSPS